MNLIVFGATGGTGRQIVKQALAEGHRVTAFARTPAKLDIRHPNLKLAKGDVLDLQSVRAAMPGHDAVIVALGAPARKAGTMRSQGTANIMTAMKDCGINRLICQSSLGFGDSAEVLHATGFVFRNIIVPILLADTFKDHERQEEAVKQSGLDWTIIRPGNMTNGPKTGTYQHGFAASRRDLKIKVSRADVAHFALRQLGNNSYLRMTPGISY
jgi:putative NADH-flavin reductase